MKERMKKFYEDHKEAIFFGSSCLVGAMIGGAYSSRKIVRAHEVIGTAMIESPNEATKVVVFKRNGHIDAFQDGPIKW